MEVAGKEWEREEKEGEGEGMDGWARVFGSGWGSRRERWR